VRAAASQQFSDGAHEHALATDRRQEADRLNQLATNERDERHPS
jgi:hypothetical protein